MKVGIGVRLGNRTDKNYLQFASQVGAPYAIISWPDKEIIPSAFEKPWPVEELQNLKKFYAENGMKIEGFENIMPEYYYKVLLDMPGKQEQMDYIKTCISNMGKAGIPVMGYNFTLSGVIARASGNWARGGAETVRFTLANAPVNDEVPAGTIFDRVMFDAPKGNRPEITLEEITQSRDWFLSELMPVAEEAGVKLAAHPEDPPVPKLRNTARILINPERFDEMFAKFDSPSNCIEFCQGTFAETGEDVYDIIRHFASKDKIGYVHFRNIKGNLKSEVPEYTEAFIDEGDIDMVRALKIYKECNYTGMFMPDHTPDVSISNPTAIGMAHAIGYIRGIMKTLDIEIQD
ncbi:MAG: mannonate dehydratase [Clostridia bacterium]